MREQFKSGDAKIDSLKNGLDNFAALGLYVDDNGDIIIKFVNTTENAKTVAIDIANAKINPKAEVNQVAGNSLQNDNVLGADESTHLTMEEFLLDGVSEKFNYTIPVYSVTSIRLKTIE